MSCAQQTGQDKKDKTKRDETRRNKGVFCNTRGTISEQLSAVSTFRSLPGCCLTRFRLKGCCRASGRFYRSVEYFSAFGALCWAHLCPSLARPLPPIPNFSARMLAPPHPVRCLFLLIPLPFFFLPLPFKKDTSRSASRTCSCTAPRSPVLSSRKSASSKSTSRPSAALNRPPPPPPPPIPLPAPRRRQRRRRRNPGRQARPLPMRAGRRSKGPKPPPPRQLPTVT